MADEGGIGRIALYEWKWEPGSNCGDSRLQVGASMQRGSGLKCGGRVRWGPSRIDRVGSQGRHWFVQIVVSILDLIGKRRQQVAADRIGRGVCSKLMDHGRRWVGARGGKIYRNAEIPNLSYRKNTEIAENFGIPNFWYGMMPYRKFLVR
ncbi:hypothetical protein OROGR_017243 [Orobanche gracilis]